MVPSRRSLSRDNPDPAVNPFNPYAWQWHHFDKSRPENLPFLQKLRALLDQYPDTTMVGEIGDDDGLARVAEYTSGGDKLHMAYCFDLLGEPHSAPFLQGVLQRFTEVVGDGWPCWALSNHDCVRSATRWLRGARAWWSGTRAPWLRIWWRGPVVRSLICRSRRR